MASRATPNQVRSRLAKITLSEPLVAPEYRVLNLGVGVQSSALALMSARGEVEPLDFAIFADTGWESRKTYAYLDWLQQQVPFPIIRAQRDGPDLGDYLIEGAQLPQKGRQHAPFFTADPDGMMSKQCSKEFKTRVVHRELRRILGLGYRERGPSEPVVEQWLGMTIDELQRISVSEKRYLHHRYPLMEKRMNKRDLYPWYQERQLPIPPKSSCIFCPLQMAARLRETLQDPQDGARLIAFDKAIRPGFKGMHGAAYLTRERKPITECDLRSDEDRGQLTFADFCGSECGV
jgi:hypothetical protein